MTPIETAVEALRAALQTVSMQEAMAQEAGDQDEQRARLADVDRLRCALRCLGVEGMVPLGPDPWAALKSVTTDLWYSTDPSPERIAEGVRPRADFEVIGTALESALEILGAAQGAPGDQRPVESVGPFLVAVLDAFEQVRRDLRDVAQGAGELHRDIGRMLG